MSEYLNSDLMWMSFWDITLKAIMALLRNAGTNLSPPPGGSHGGTEAPAFSRGHGSVMGRGQLHALPVCVCVGGVSGDLSEGGTEARARGLESTYLRISSLCSVNISV